SSPAVDQHFVYVASSTGQVYAFSRDKGILQWQQSVVPQTASATPATTAKVDQDDVTDTPEPGIDKSSPAVTQTQLFIGTSVGDLVALDKSSGQVQWRFATGRTIASSPVVSDKTVYTASRNGLIYAVNTQTGKQQWVFDTEGIVDASPYVM